MRILSQDTINQAAAEKSLFCFNAMHDAQLLRNRTPVPSEAIAESS